MSVVQRGIPQVIDNELERSESVKIRIGQEQQLRNLPKNRIDSNVQVENRCVTIIILVQKFI